MATIGDGQYVLFFDTETTGKAQFDLPASSDVQPYVVQLGAVLCDPEGNEVSVLNTLVELPLGREVEPGALAVHGISTEAANQGGLSRGMVLRTFYEMAWRAQVIVAHNLKFDRLVMEAMEIRQSNDDWDLDDFVFYNSSLPSPALGGVVKVGCDPLCKFRKLFCTMESATPVMRLPHKGRWQGRGKGSYKWPTLTEAVWHFTGQTLEGAHDALVDVRGCKDVYYALKGIERGSGDGCGTGWTGDDLRQIVESGDGGADDA